MKPAAHSLSRTVLGAPLWVAQLATGAKSFRDNPLIGSKPLNRLGLHETRMRLAHRLAWKRRAALAHLVEPAHRSQFFADGFVVIENFLDAPSFSELQRGVLDHRAPVREMMQGDTITRRMAIDPRFLAAVPAVRQLIAEPRWRGLMRYVSSYDSEPLYYVQTILTGLNDAPPDPQTALHADTFHPTVKAWYFLEDVAEEDGPFVYVPGSHRLTPQRLAWERARSLMAPDGVDHLSARGSMRIDIAELDALGLPQPRKLAVPANTLVVADTCGFHARGGSARPSRRVELWAYARRNPFYPWTGLDPLSLAGIAERRIGAMWALRDRFEKWIGQPWRDAGLKRPLDA